MTARATCARLVLSRDDGTRESVVIIAPDGREARDYAQGVADAWNTRRARMIGEGAPLWRVQDEGTKA